MKLSLLKKKMREHIYMEDEDALDVVMAATISNIMQLGQPVWLVLIGAPSSGKTQYILPLEHSQPAGEKIIHQVTDLTPNTFLSGSKVGGGGHSLLHKIGDHGMMLFPDLTSLFSKDSQVLQEILGQLRHVYDGYLTKHTGNGDPLEWKGSMGIIAASTASLYSHFEKISDMGERFMYYRLKPFNKDNALDKALGRKLYGKELDIHIGELYKDYLGSVIQGGHKTPVLSDSDNAAIKEMAKFASIIRTSVHTNMRSGEVDRIPEPEMPMRTSLQLRGIALGLMVMNAHETGDPTLKPNNIRALEWCAYSLADDERRKTLQTLAQYPSGATSAGIAMALDLPTNSTNAYLQQLNALRVCRRMHGATNANTWQLQDESVRDIVLRLADIEVQKGIIFGNDLKEEETVDW